jgi:rRNA maturation endonuclease Nob1
MEKIICENCGEEVARPVLKGLENNDECPSCGESLFVKTQVKLDLGEEE